MPTKGEIRLVNLDPTVGDEIRKVRPAVVVSRDAVGVLAVRVVVPITGWQDRFRGCDWLVRLDPNSGNGLDKPSVADALQVRSVATRRFVRRIGLASDEELARIAAGLKVVFEF